LTDAPVGVVLIHAKSSIEARVALTFRDVDFTKCAGESRQAVTEVPIDDVYAGAAVHARVTHALLYISIADRAGPSGLADAHEGIFQIQAHTLLLTGETQALINVIFTVDAIEAWCAITAVVTNLILAGASVLTGH
jgi:hypothetical protein